MTFSKMHILFAVSLALAFSTLPSRAMPLLQDIHPVENYVPLNTYETFESPLPEDTLIDLSVDLKIKTADLYALSVFYTYDTLSASDKAALTAQRALNSTIDAEINLCLWTNPGNCWPLWSNGHRREIQRGWNLLRKSGEKDYDTRMEYVSKGKEIAAGWARIVRSKEQQWRAARSDPAESDGCSNNAGEVWDNGTSKCAPGSAMNGRDAWRRLK